MTHIFRAITFSFFLISSNSFPSVHRISSQFNRINLNIPVRALSMDTLSLVKPFSPLIGFYLVMLAPIYGNGIFGGMTDFSTVTPRGTPNEAIVCPPNFCPKHSFCSISPVHDCNISSLESAWEEMLKMQPRISRISADPTNNRRTVVQRSLLFRFPDVITVQFIDNGNGKSTIAMHSYSIYGASDLGVNGNRVNRWISDLSNAVKGTSTRN